MLSAAVLLMLSSMLCSLRLSSGGSFPKPLSAQEEREYLLRAAEGDLAARNILIERNLRLVAHIMKNGQSAGTISQSADCGNVPLHLPQKADTHTLAGVCFCFQVFQSTSTHAE